MKQIINKTNFKDKCYFLTDDCFLWRGLDNSFKTKWCGIWKGNIKFFEYFAYKINSTWLSPNLCDKTIIEFYKTEHNYELKQEALKINETIFPFENSIVSILSIKNKTNQKKKINISVEVAINIREKGENWHLRTYKVCKNDLRNCIIAESNILNKKYCAIYGCANAKSISGLKQISKQAEIKINFDETYKDHFPNSKQRCFLAGNYEVNFQLNPNEEVKIPFIYSCCENQKDIFQTFDKSINNWHHNLRKLKIKTELKLKQKIKTPDKSINNAYLIAQYDLLSLLHKSDFGLGMFAGFPWFLSFWSRDILWSLPGLIQMNFLDETKQILSTIAQFYDEKKDKNLFANGINGIPTKINLDKTIQYYSCDCNPLFLIAYNQYKNFGGKTTKLLDKTEKKIKHYLRLDNYIVDTNNNNNQNSKQQHTWMDTITRNGTPTEVQALWCYALAGDKNNKKYFNKMKREINESFFNSQNNYFFDTLNIQTKETSQKIRPNALVALMFNLVDEQKAVRALDTTKKQLDGDFGIRTLSNKDIDYSPENYHNGSAWGLTSMWGACAYFNYNYNDDAINLLKKTANQIQANMPFGFDECVNASSGKSLGAAPQAWSAALFVHAIDNYLFGIKPEENNIISINPKLPCGWDWAEMTDKKIRGNVFDIKLSGIKNKNNNKKLKIKINFKNLKDNTLIKVFNLNNEYEIIKPKKTTIIEI